MTGPALLAGVCRPAGGSTECEKGPAMSTETTQTKPGMSRKMLRGIRDRADRGALSPSLTDERPERQELQSVGGR